MAHDSLSKLTQASRMLAEASTLEDIQQIRGIAQMAAEYAKAAKLGLEAQNTAAEIKLRAERKAGELLAELKREPGARSDLTSSGVGRGDTPYSQALESSDTTRQTAHIWQKIATIPEPEFEEFIEETKEAKRELTTNGALKVANGDARKKERTDRINDIARNNRPLGTQQQYPVILADPPWRYEHSKTTSREIENHYPTMDLAEICQLPVSELATPDAILFLWTTSPKLAESLQVVEAWGFTYRTCMVWVKDRIGMGYYARQRHELLLICRRGDIPVPDPEARFDSVIEAPRTEHSAKPVEAYERIEAMYPDFDKIELFARATRPGWAAWGNQSA